MDRLDDIGKLVLRISVAGLLLLHGLAKFNAQALGGLQEMLAGKGLPEFLAYGVYLGEVVAPILMIIGYFTRPAAIVMAINMIVAVALAHSHQLVLLNDNGGLQLELQWLFLFGAISVALLGAGKISVSGGNGKWH